MLTPAEVAYLDQQRRQVSLGIRRHGCFVFYISDADCECCRVTDGNRADRRARARSSRRSAASPPFAYTVGMHGVGHPEMLVFGLAQEASRTLLTGLAHGVREHSRDLTVGDLVSAGPNEQLKLLVEHLPNPGQILHQANDYYDRPPEASVEAVQLSWPDAAGHWPGDARCEGGAARQPRPGRFRA
ncbi:MAG: DUF4262 domain-containing protein [Ornithinibacter sp.]